MAERGRSKLFHAIVVAGAALGGACSSGLPIRADASHDAAAETSPDRRPGSDGIVIDLAPRDEAAADAACADPQFHNCTTISDCFTCGCTCPQLTDGSACFPCYI